MTTYAQARIADPSPYFETPDQVLNDDKLCHEDKEKVLRSMVLDADQRLYATAEGMAVGDIVYTAKDLQSALIQLDEIKEPETADDPAQKTSRFQRIMVVTTVNQVLNREIAQVAYDIASVAGGKVHLLNAVPSEFDRAGLAASGAMVTAVPLVVTDDGQIKDDRMDQLTKLRAELDPTVETDVEVRSGQIEEVIAAYADECDANLIVVGAPNRSWLEALLGAPIAKRVTKSAPCPVLVVPEPA